MIDDFDLWVIVGVVALVAIPGGLAYYLAIKITKKKTLSIIIGTVAAIAAIMFLFFYRATDGLQRTIVNDTETGYSYILTKTENSLYGIENMEKTTIIPPVYNEVHFRNKKLKRTISPTFVCAKSNADASGNATWALYDTAGNVIIPIEMGYNGINTRDNYIHCYYGVDFLETRSALYDGSGRMKIDIDKGFTTFGPVEYIETASKHPYAESIREIRRIERDKSNIIRGWILNGSDAINRKSEFVFFDLNTWQPIFTKCTDGESDEGISSGCLICENGFFKFSNGQYICVYDKNQECIIPFDRHYKKIYSVKDGIYTYFVVGFDDDCWGICDIKGTEIVRPSYKYKNTEGLIYVKGYGFRYGGDDYYHSAYEIDEIIEETESMYVYLDELSIGHAQ